LDLIRFETGEYGLQEVHDDGTLTTLWDHEADQLDFGKRSWTFIRTRAEGEWYNPDDPDDFWQSLEGVREIPPPEDPR
jgi:hypothetical protein